MKKLCFMFVLLFTIVSTTNCMMELFFCPSQESATSKNNEITREQLEKIEQSRNRFELVKKIIFEPSEKNIFCAGKLYKYLEDMECVELLDKMLDKVVTVPKYQQRMYFDAAYGLANSLADFRDEEISFYALDVLLNQLTYEEQKQKKRALNY